MKRITPSEAAIRKFKREYHAVECVFNHMPYPDDSDIAVEDLGGNLFRCSCQGKLGIYKQDIKVSPALDCCLIELNNIATVK